MKTLTLTTLAALLLPVAALAQDQPPVVSDAYAISSNPTAGAAFMAIHNPRHEACTLNAVSTPAAARAELHTHTSEGGVMKMQKLDGLTVPAEGDAVLRRGADHVMLMGLTKPLKDGDTVALTLDFGPCGTVEAAVPVDSKHAPAAAPAAGMEGMKMDPAMDHTAPAAN